MRDERGKYHELLHKYTTREIPDYSRISDISLNLRLSQTESRIILLIEKVHNTKSRNKYRLMRYEIWIILLDENLKVLIQELVRREKEALKRISLRIGGDILEVQIFLGRKTKTIPVQSRTEALKVIKDELTPYLKRGDSLVWMKEPGYTEYRRAIIVDDGNKVKSNQARIIGGSKMAKVTKTTKVKKTAPVSTKGAVKKTTGKVAKASTPSPAKTPRINQTDAIVKALKTLPQRGKKIEEIAAQVHKITGGTISNLEIRTKDFGKVLVSYGVLTLKNDVFKPV